MTARERHELAQRALARTAAARADLATALSDVTTLGADIGSIPRAVTSIRLALIETDAAHIVMRTLAEMLEEISDRRNGK